jgi:oxygen-dependent protoporphyrinogen oxidase
MSRPHVVVVGGGIAGLAAARTLLQADGAAPHVTLLEADGRLGGKISTVRIASKSVDVGAEALLARVPAGIELCRELGLEGELTSPLETSTYVWARGRLRELPAGILGGLPDGVGPVLRSGILSPGGLARATLDLALPRSSADGDCSVGELVGARLGKQALDRLVDPLLGTIYGADCHSLSLRATAPQIEKIAREHRSLILGLRAAKPPPRSGPMFLTVAGGLQRIVERLGEELCDVELRLGTPAELLEHAPGGRYRLQLPAGETLLADGVVIAAPADRAARILGYVSPSAATELRSVRYVSTVVVTLRYAGSAAPRPLGGTGFLVPQSERRLLGACTWLSAKWAHLAADGELWLRCSIARSAVSQARELDDEALVRRVAQELREAMGLSGAPLDWLVTRWENALPLYEPGHLDRLARLKEHMVLLGGVALAGSAYGGMGVPQCIMQGQVAARRVLDAIEERFEPARQGELSGEGNALAEA